MKAQLFFGVVSVFLALFFRHRIGANIAARSVLVGPCHHGMARPQVADRGTASDKEGSCE